MDVTYKNLWCKFKFGLQIKLARTYKLAFKLNLNLRERFILENMILKYTDILYSNPYHTGDVVLEVGSEPFVKPGVTPPMRGDEVSEPLVTKFVRNNGHYWHFVHSAGYPILV